MRRVVFYSLLLGAACAVPPVLATRTSGVDAQVELGAAVYATHCAHCHGEAGEGLDDAPALVGAGALPERPRAGQRRQAHFRTALDVATFVTTNMPPDEDDRRLLDERDYWAVLAFALRANGAQLDTPVNANNAGRIMLRTR